MNEAARQVIQLLTDFLQIGFLSIGGGYAIIPLIKERMVDIQHWVTLREFTDIITLSQMTPGPLAVNTATFVGMRIAGVPGAVAATLGCIASGIAISLLLYRFFNKHKESNAIAEVLKALKATSLGLIMSAAATILLIAFYGASGQPLHYGRINTTALGISLAALLLARKFNLNPVLIMLLAGGAGYLAYA